jgi:hypothetical protein
MKPYIPETSLFNWYLDELREFTQPQRQEILTRVWNQLSQAQKRNNLKWACILFWHLTERSAEDWKIFLEPEIYTDYDTNRHLKNEKTTDAKVRMTIISHKPELVFHLNPPATDHELFLAISKKPMIARQPQYQREDWLKWFTLGKLLINDEYKSSLPMRKQDFEIWAPYWRHILNISNEP